MIRFPADQAGKAYAGRRKIPFSIKDFSASVVSGIPQGSSGNHMT
jgi:hypothetical protein